MKSYRPASGAEGEWFREKFCYQCQKENYPDGPFCPILSATLAYQVDDPKYPKEWVHDNENGTRCTAFVRRET